MNLQCKIASNTHTQALDIPPSPSARIERNKGNGALLLLLLLCERAVWETRLYETFGMYVNGTHKYTSEKKTIA